jgi:hypothetical protein
MCTFKFPFDAYENIELSELIQKGVFEPIPEGSYSKGLIELQTQMLQVDEAARPNIEAVIYLISNLKNKPLPKPIPQPE